MSKQANQVIVSQGYKGHRLMYVRLLAKASLERGRTPVVFLPRGATSSPEFLVHLADLPEVQIRALDGNADLRQLRQSLPTRFDFPVVFAEGDAWLRQLAFSRRMRGGANILVMRNPNATAATRFRPARVATKFALIWWLRSLRGYSVYILGDSIASGADGWTVADPVTMSADVQDRKTVRDEWSAATSERPLYWVGVVGGIGPRKNLRLVSEALASVGPRFGLVVAGEAETGENDVEEWLVGARRAGISVVRVAGTLGEREFDAVVAALDVVVVAHSNEGPSGIVAKAIVAGTPVAAAGAQSLRRVAQSSNGEVTWSELDPSAIARSIESLATREDKPRSVRQFTTASFTGPLLSTRAGGRRREN